MPSLGKKFASLSLLAALSLSSSGCIKKILTDGQIASTRKGSAAVNTISDWDVAYRAASAGLAQFEGMHYLAPYNEDAIFLLTRGWAAVGFGFIEDEMEQAEDVYGPESEMARYHKQRAIAAYARSVFYGTKLLELHNEGFQPAKRNADTMRAWLANFTEAEDAETLFWTGQAWMSRVNLMKDSPEMVAELYVGQLMVKHAVGIDSTYNNGSGHAILGAYHARTAMAELDESKTHFEEALKISGGKFLLTKVNYATKYYCIKGDKDNYTKTLKEVLDAGDVFPEQRLPNTIAKRRARRYLQPKRMEACGF
jgi:tetratricopeptide (TPR) repeat protein